MEEVVGERPFPIGGSEAKYVGICYWASAETCPKNVTVYSDNSGHSAPVRVEG